MTIRIIHLVDDFGAGGVMRGLDYMSTPGFFGAGAHVEVAPVRRGMLRAPQFEADVVVSHLSISWRNLPTLIALRARYAHLPFIHVEHSYSEAFVAHNVRAKRRFARLLRISYALFDRVIAVSSAQANWMTNRSLVSPEALRVIPTSVDLEPFLAIDPAPGRRAKVIGAVGRFHRQKGFADLIAAFRAAAGPDQVLRLIGDGPEADALRSAAGEDPRIEFQPFTSDLPSAYAACDVIAVPSKWEPYGLVALEARASGRPVLAAKVDGLIDQTEEGCIGVGEDDWARAIADAPYAVNTAKVAAARREAIGQNQRFKSEWRRLIAEFAASSMQAADFARSAVAAA